MNIGKSNKQENSKTAEFKNGNGTMLEGTTNRK